MNFPRFVEVAAQGDEADNLALFLNDKGWKAFCSSSLETKTSFLGVLSPEALTI
jgi:hypothetical protein